SSHSYVHAPLSRRLTDSPWGIDYFIYCYGDTRYLHSFPTRRSSDLLVAAATRHRDVIMPGYTHLQRAQPILLAHHLLALEVGVRSEEHTSELQSRGHLVCRLLLEKKKNYSYTAYIPDVHKTARMQEL